MGENYLIYMGLRETMFPQLFLTITNITVEIPIEIVLTFMQTALN